MKSFKDCDPRDYQLMVLTTMLAYGLFWLRFDLNKAWIAGIIGSALATQYVATRLWKLRCFEWKSAAISGLSLAILMRSNSLTLSVGLACLAILSKFIFRWKGKHLFNPTNFALDLGVLATGQVWITPNQWGNGAILAFFIACMGSFVVERAARSDVSFSFLVTYSAAILMHAAWIGEPFLTAVKRLQTGSLLVFIFFMISDPKTTPDARSGRIVFGALVALVGIYLQISQGVQAGLLVTLAFASLTVPAMDRIFPGKKYQWKALCAPLEPPTLVL